MIQLFYLTTWKKLVQNHSPGKTFVQLKQKIMINWDLKIRLQIQICKTTSFTNFDKYKSVFVQLCLLAVRKPSSCLQRDLEGRSNELILVLVL